MVGYSGGTAMGDDDADGDNGIGTMMGDNNGDDSSTVISNMVGDVPSFMAGDKGVLSPW